MTSSKTLFYLCISFILGIFTESFIKIPHIFLWGFLFLGVLFILAPLFLSKNNFAIFGFLILFFVLGILRVQISEFNIASDKLSKFNDNGEVKLEGYVAAEPDIRETTQMLKIKVGLPAQAGESLVLITANKYPEYKYLDKIKITGKLKTPQEFEDFNYKNYLMKDGIYSVMSFPKMELFEKQQYTAYSYIYEKIVFLKQKIRQSIQSNFSPPKSSILEGTILGDNGAMSDDLKNKLNITGLRHVIAVSGTHIVILSSILMSLLLAIGLSRGKAFYFAVVLIFLYVVLTGLSASGVRAGIMGSLYLLAQKFGRQGAGIRILTLAAASMLIFNPLLLAFDVGFQLSFLAVIGLVYLQPVFSNGFEKITNGKAKEFTEIISATFAAQVFTLPILIYSFGNVSFVSPVTNLLVLPVVYWLMIFGFLSSFLGIFWNALGWILSVPCYFLLEYFLWVINFFSQPWAQKTFENVHWVWLVILYLIIISATKFLYKKYIHIF